MTDSNPSSSAAPPPLSRLALHTITNKPWSLRECIDAYAAAGIGGISVWREAIEPVGIDEASRMLEDSPLRVSALVRGGFLVHSERDARQLAIDENRRCIDDAAAIGAEMVVIVPGASPEVPLEDGREMVRDGLAKLIEHAARSDVRLALEPLHPMYAADRSCINTMTQASEICDSINHPVLGVAVDTYHVWWDPALADEISALGATGRLFAFHVNDWLPDTFDRLLDRGLMGEGCIPIRAIRAMMERAAFDGMIEVEILSERWWQADQDDFVQRIVHGYARCV